MPTYMLKGMKIRWFLLEHSQREKRQRKFIGIPVNQRIWEVSLMHALKINPYACSISHIIAFFFFLNFTFWLLFYPSSIKRLRAPKVLSYKICQSQSELRTVLTCPFFKNPCEKQTVLVEQQTLVTFPL